MLVNILDFFKYSGLPNHFLSPKQELLNGWSTPSCQIADPLYPQISNHWNTGTCLKHLNCSGSMSHSQRGMKNSDAFSIYWQ